MKKALVLILLFLANALFPQDIDSEYKVDLATLSYSKNGEIYIYNDITKITEVVKFNPKKYEFISTYGNGKFILLQDIESFHIYWYTPKMQLIGLTECLYGGTSSDRRNYPDSDRRYVTTRISTYAFDAAEISNCEIIIQFPFSLYLWAEKYQENQYYYDLYMNWYENQTTDKITEMADQISSMEKPVLSAEYLQVVTDYMKSDEFKNAMTDFICYYGISNATKNYILSLLNEYGLSFEKLLRRIDEMTGVVKTQRKNEIIDWNLYKQSLSNFKENRFLLIQSLK